MRAFSRLATSALDLVAIQYGLFSMGLFSRKLNKNFFFQNIKKNQKQKVRGQSFHVLQTDIEKMETK